MAKIAIRADGGKDIGMGHIMRTLVLAKELSKENEVIYICRKSRSDKFKYHSGITKIKESNFQFFEIGEENFIEDIKSIQKELNLDMLITDSYDVNEKYFDRLSNCFEFQGYIDDINICRLNVDFIINQNINAKNYNYDTYPNTNTKLFLGAKYILLRSEFKANNDQKFRGKVKNIFVTVGGMDKDRNTIKIVDLLKKYNSNIHIIVGGAFDNDLISALKVLSNEDNKIILHFNCSMSKIMKMCDIAISSCGSTLYELCATGLPTVGVVIAKNQEQIAKKMNEEGAIINSGWALYNNIEILQENIERIMNSSKIRNKITNKQKDIVDGLGAYRLGEEINNLINRNKNLQKYKLDSCNI